MKINVLAIGAHPDDVELGASGTLLSMKEQGYSIGIIDMTRGELGTRGSAELRTEEAERSAKILKLDARENLDLSDGFFEENEASLLKLVYAIRKYQPDVVLANAMHDRHPDHGRAGKLISRACFLSGLIKIKTLNEGVEQAKWRPKAVYHYMQDMNLKADFVVDVTAHWKTKMESILAFSSQFYDPSSQEPESPISSKAFMDFLEGRARDIGRNIGVEFGEAFTVDRPIGVKNIMDLQ